MKSSVPENKKISLGKKILFLIIIFLLFFIVLEIGLRGYYFIHNKKVTRVENYSKRYGWIIQPNIKSTATFDGYGEIHFSTTKYGFRRFGDVNTDRTKIFVIGDSQTESRKVSDGGTYFDYIAEKTNAEIFAFGVGGYGTFQEYMILNDYFDTIKPDLILWQFCENDFWNNSFDLESTDWIKSNNMVRPYYYYYKNKKIEYKFPNHSWLYRKVLRYSYLFRFLNQKLVILMADNFGMSDSNQPLQKRPLFNEAVKTTSEILKLAKRRVGKVPIIAFSACGTSEKMVQNEVFAKICKDVGINYINGIPDSVYTAAKAGIKVNGMPYDGHWNNTGNAIAGKIIVNYLINNNFLKK